MTAEYDSLMKNKTWSLIPLPLGKNLVGCKWVYKTKFIVDEHIEKDKARLVAKGFNQLEGINYNETFATIAKMNTIRTILSITSYYKWEMHQMDVKSVFLNGNFNEEIYMQQTLGFINVESSNLVCKLHM